MIRPGVLASLTVILLASTLPAPAAADDRVAAMGRRVAASLAGPPRLAPAPYLEVVTRDRPLRVPERGKDPHEEPYHETGLWKLLAPVRIDVIGFVLTDTGGSYLLLIDNFSLPAAARSVVDPHELVRSLRL